MTDTPAASGSADVQAVREALKKALTDLDDFMQGYDWIGTGSTASGKLVEKEWRALRKRLRSALPALDAIEKEMGRLRMERDENFALFEATMADRAKAETRLANAEAALRRIRNERRVEAATYIEPETVMVGELSVDDAQVGADDVTAEGVEIMRQKAAPTIGNEADWEPDEQIWTPGGSSYTTERMLKATPAPEREGEDALPPIIEGPDFDEGVTYAICVLAKLVGAKDWSIKDGSEEYEPDVRATIRDVLRSARLYDDEDGRWATLATPTAPDRAADALLREAIVRLTKEAGDYSATSDRWIMGKRVGLLEAAEVLDRIIADAALQGDVGAGAGPSNHEDCGWPHCDCRIDVDGCRGVRPPRPATTPPAVDTAPAEADDE